MNEPLKSGIATLIGYRNGRLAIVKWDAGQNAPGAAWARQSLPPIVWNGRVNPELDSSLKWGETIGNTLRVWRTGVGIDRRGNLIFVAADAQTVISLAKILQHAGAVRAMQFDINPYWHTLITYRHQRGLVPTMVEPQPNTPRSATSSRTTATSSPSTAACAARSPSHSSRERDRVAQRDTLRLLSHRCGTT
jgi:hypothetical protein